MSGKTKVGRRVARLGRGAKGVVAVLVVAAMAASPLGAAALASAGGEEGSAVLQAGTEWQVASAEEGGADAAQGQVAGSGADASQGQTTDEGLQWTVTEYDADAVMAAARAAGLAGADALERYLAGQELTDDEMLSIDVRTLRAINEKLAQEIAGKQAVLGHVDWEVEDPRSNETADADAQSAYAGDGDSSTQEADSASGSSYVPGTIGYNLTTRKFVAVVGEQARQVAQENGLYASVMVAQAILESASGNSALSRPPYNNLFGIKGAYNGQSVTMRTGEDDGTGAKYYIDAAFRAYPSVRESLKDYADLLTNSMGSFYAGALKENAAIYADACTWLQGRYATDTSYAAKLCDIIDAYDLTRYDEPLDYELVGTYQAQAKNPVTGGLAFDLMTGQRIMEERGLTDLVAEATSHLGDPYVWGGEAPGGFDCSGLVQYSYKTAMGVSLPRVADAQSTKGEDVALSDVHMGDLLFFENADGEVSHVAIYLGEGCYLEAPHEGDVVKVTSFEEHEPSFAKRVLETRPVEQASEAESAVLPPQAYYQDDAYYAFLGLW